MSAFGQGDDGDPGPAVSVVVPCYNEEAVIGESYRRLEAACAGTLESYEIIFGNDGSDDGTLALLEELAAADPRVRVTSHAVNRGAGFTYREMYAAARGEVIVQMDADMAMPPAEVLGRLLPALGGAEMAVASRYRGVRPDYPLKRRVFSRGYRWLVHLLFRLDVADTQTGFLAFRRRILDEFTLVSDGFEMLLELIARTQAAGFRIVEVGLPWHHDTRSGETDVWRESLKMLAGTLKVRLLLWRRGSAVAGDGEGAQPGDGAKGGERCRT